MNTKTLAIVLATTLVTSTKVLLADPTPAPAQKDLERVRQDAQHFDNPGSNAPRAGHTDGSAGGGTSVPVAVPRQSTAPTQHTQSPDRPVLTKPTTTTTQKPVKKEPPSPVIPTGDKK